MPDPQQPDYDALAKQQGGVDYDAIAAQVEGGTTTPAPTEERSMLGSVGHGLADFWEQVNPVTAIQNIVGAAKDPKAAAEALWKAHHDLWRSADEDLKNATPTNGKYVDAAVKRLNASIPLFGLMMQAQAEKGAKGDWAGLIGGSAGIAANLKLPEIIKAVAPKGAVKIAPGLGVATPAEAAMTARAEALGVPVDAGTATANPVVRAAQFGADRTLIGSKIAANAAEAQAQGAKTAIGTMAGKLSPAAETPETAGAGLRDALTGEMAGQHGKANTAYGTLRSIEKATPIDVDFSTTRQAMQPVYDQMQRQLPVTIRANSPGWTALDQFMKGPVVRPLSEADADLSVIKGMAREGDPYLRSNGQRIASMLSSTADRDIQAAVAKAGPNAVAALQEGRAATRAKYAAADVLGQFRDEPVKAFADATLREDAGINRLRAVQKVTPQALPAIGRAYLDDLVGEATQKGGFGGKKALSNWQTLGAETKKLLFPDPQMRADLDAIFHTMRRAAEDINPSGSAHTAFMYGELLHLAVSPYTAVPLQIVGGTVAKLMRTKAGIRILRDGLVLPRSHPLAVKAAQKIAELQAQTVGRGLGPVSVPVAAQDQTGTTP